jgi:uncharacterized membrane protein
MSHLIKITHAAFSASALVVGFTFPFILLHLAMQGYYLAVFALLIFAPSFAAFLASEYR